MKVGSLRLFEKASKIPAPPRHPELIQPTITGALLTALADSTYSESQRRTAARMFLTHMIWIEDNYIRQMRSAADTLHFWLDPKPSEKGLTAFDDAVMANIVYWNIYRDSSSTDYSNKRLAAFSRLEACITVFGITDPGVREFVKMFLVTDQQVPLEKSYMLYTSLEPDAERPAIESFLRRCTKEHSGAFRLPFMLEVSRRFAALLPANT